MSSRGGTVSVRVASTAGSRWNPFAGPAAAVAARRGTPRPMTRSGPAADASTASRPSHGPTPGVGTEATCRRYSTPSSSRGTISSRAASPRTSKRCWRRGKASFSTPWSRCPFTPRDFDLADTIRPSFSRGACRGGSESLRETGCGDRWRRARNRRSRERNAWQTFVEPSGRFRAYAARRSSSSMM